MKKINESKLYNGTYWDGYRLGDVLKFNNKDLNFYIQNIIGTYKNIDYHSYKYPGSIAHKYINKTKKNNDYNILNNIIKSKVKNQNNHPDTLFLHIRIGEILCKYIYPDNLRNTPLIYAKVGDNDWWNDIINYIKKNNIKKVVIIAGSLFKKCLKESKDYIEDRVHFLKQNGLKIKYNLGKSPDEDILMCAYVKHFITTGGGYGNLIKQLNKLNKIN